MLRNIFTMIKTRITSNETKAERTVTGTVMSISELNMEIYRAGFNAGKNVGYKDGIAGRMKPSDL